MTFRRVNDFTTDKPVMLDRELSQLESNVDDEFRALEKRTSPRLNVDSFTPLGADSVVALLPDHQLSVDTSQGNARAVLPPLSAANFGARFVLITRNGLNGIVVSCQDPAVLHNGGAFPTVAGAGVRVFYCDSQGYYS